jgi:hypothetical protein
MTVAIGAVVLFVGVKYVLPRLKGMMKKKSMEAGSQYYDEGQNPYYMNVGPYRYFGQGYSHLEGGLRT